MIENSTQLNDWLLYYYNECDLLASDRIQRTIDGDPLLQHDYLELVTLLDAMTVKALEPSTASVQRILEYA
jgi:hypothetical protein